jgi:cyclic pyranopterin phosphate synthase
MESCGTTTPTETTTPFGEIGTLRVAVTDRCDLRCTYCRPIGARPHDIVHGVADLELLTDQIGWIHRRARLHRIKLTGGEPLLHPDLETLIVRLDGLDPRPELSLTTNGIHLAERAVALRAAGLDRVTVSLDTLDADGYRRLTGGNVDRVLRGLDAARRARLDPVKLNAVLRRSSWRDDVPALLDLAADHDFEIRFIELMRTGTAPVWCRSERIPAHEVRDALHDTQALEIGPEPRTVGAAPARTEHLRWRGRDVRVGWIEPVSHPFCGRCDRLRLHPDGSLARCLMDPLRLDLARLRRDAGDRPAERAVRAFLDGKTPASDMATGWPMARLGG